MKRCLILFAVTGVLAGNALAGQYGRATPWEDQIHALSYLVMHLSSINAINGLNLTRQQAVQLRELSRRIEAQDAKVPNLRGPMRPDLAEVRDAYTEVRALTIMGQEVPETLEKKILGVRAIESAVIQASLAAAQPSRQTCVRCHGEPRSRDLRGSQTAGGATDRASPSQQADREKVQAHHLGIFGRKGATELRSLVSSVDRILNAEQKAAVQNFSCCLVPPKAMSDPVRAGQAAGGEKEVDLLRRVRGFSAGAWANVKPRLLDRLDMILVFQRAGVSESEKAAARDKAARIYEEARALSDTEFELQKDQLAAGLHSIVRPVKETPNEMQQLSIAMFLTVPGASEVYTKLIQRLEAARR